MKTPGAWFLLLLAVCIIGPYVLGVRPRSRREWTYVSLTVTFAGWLLLMMVYVR